MTEHTVCPKRHVYLACQWCPCSEEWMMKGVFRCAQDAVKFSQNHIESSVRANKPLEFWRVEKYELNLASAECVWGSESVVQPATIGAPDCV